MKNKRLKKEFAKAFGWAKKTSPYEYSRDTEYRDDCSWEEIFTEIGRIKADAQKFYFLERLDYMDNRVRKLEKHPQINEGAMD